MTINGLPLWYALLFVISLSVSAALWAALICMAVADWARRGRP